METRLAVGYGPLSSLNSPFCRSAELLIAVAILGIFATIIDGQVDRREIRAYKREFRRRFDLSRRQVNTIAAVAIGRITLAGETGVIESACDALNEHLDTSHKIWVMHWISEVLIADGKIHEDEDCFLNYLAEKLCLIDTLEEIPRTVT